MAIAFHNSTTNSLSGLGNGATFGFTKPTVSAGDILIMVVGTNDSNTSAATITAPSGWTAIGSRQVVNGSIAFISVECWWALQSVSGSATWSVSGTGNTALSWTCASFSGVDNTTPIDATGTGNTNTGSASISVSTFNTVTNHALELWGIVDWNAGAFSDASFTVLQNGGIGTNVSAALGYANSATSPAGATGATTVSDNASATGQELAYQQFALRPASGAAATPSYLPLLGVGRVAPLDLANPLDRKIIRQLRRPSLVRSGWDG